MDVAQLISDSQAGDTNAFAEIIRQHQNRCLAIALGKTGDVEIARDVVQESFIVAWRHLEDLKDPGAFSSWLRTIVIRRCYRHNHSRTADVPIDMLSDAGSVEKEVQSNEERKILYQAIEALPKLQRDMVLLHYFEGASHAEVADYLGLPKSKVNNQLHAARQHLKGRIYEMAKDTFETIRYDDDSAKNMAEIVAVHGSLVEARADDLGILDTLGSSNATMFVVQRSDDGTLLCVSSEAPDKNDSWSLMDSDNAYRGIQEANIQETVRALSGERDNAILETGIKAVDLFAPIPRGGSVGVFGGAGVGRAVFATEMIQRQASFAGHASLFFYVGYFDLFGTKEMVANESLFAKDRYANVSTAWIAHPRAADPDYAASADYVDARLFFSPMLGVRGVWPAVDPLRSTSVMLENGLVSERHKTLVRDARETLAAAEGAISQSSFFEALAVGARESARAERLVAFERAWDSGDAQQRQTLRRAEWITHLLKQPFYCAEDFTGRPGVTMTLEESLDALETILSGQLDERDSADFAWGEFPE